MPQSTMLSAIVSLCFLNSAFAATIGQVDDFEDGTSMGWGARVQTVTVETDGGPNGAGDGFLSYTSSSTSFVPNGRMVIPNEAGNSQWAGDYIAEGIEAISFDANNLGNSQLDVRLAISDGLNWFASSDPTTLAPGSGWTSLDFPLSSQVMTAITGSATLPEVLANVTRVRILSSANLPTVGLGRVQGDLIAGTLGIDNVSAVGAAIPEPSSLTTFGVGLVSLLCWRVRN